MFKALKSLFSSSSDLKPDEYTVITYSEGKEYVSHDGLGLKTEQRPPESESEPESVFEGGSGADNFDAADDANENGLGSGFRALLSDQDINSGGDLGLGLDSLLSGNDGGINPATGLPMMDDMMDMGGNMYGMSGDDSFVGTGIDDSMSSGFDDGFGSDDSFTFDSDF